MRWERERKMSNSLNKEEIYRVVSTIAESEKFKQDAFFFCGFPSESPDEELLAASKAYLESVDNDTETDEIKERLVKALRSSLDKKKVLADKDNITSNEKEIREVLESRDNL